MPKSASSLARGLEPLGHLLWPLFLVWSGLTGLLWFAGEGWTTQIGNSGLREAVSFLVRSADAIWLLLGAVNVYLPLAQAEGLQRARFISLTIVVTAGALAWISTVTGYPLGRVAYTDQLGAKVGPVPVGWIFLWLALVLSSRALVARVAPRLSHTGVALGAGALAMITDLNLEPLASKLRLYWFWYETGTNRPTNPGWQNSLTWLLVATALAWLAREQRVVARPSAASLRAALVIIVINVVFLVGHLRGFVVG